ncbi:MAG: hypothetical protein KBE23_03655 [Chloroflexi bacterium]|nr:hypothetical protein [Chloroflexota bacterium]MBP7041809.1 hypothetical protein [Chloroflexota bacterium]
MRGFQENQITKFNSWIEDKLVRRRFWVITLLSVLFVVLEILEELVPESRVRHQIEILSILLFFLLLFIIWILLEHVLKITRIKNHALKILQIKHDLSAKLALTTEWDEMITALYEFPRTHNPLIIPSLLVFNPQSAKFEAVNEQKFCEQALSANAQSPIPAMYYTNTSGHPTTLHAIELPPTEIPNSQTNLPNMYCLPLFWGESLIARMFLTLPSEANLPEEQRDIFNYVASDIAIALVSAQRQQHQSMQLVSQTRDTERLSISRDLHDTLGQNLVYLHLKLDQMARDADKANLSETRADLEQMRTVANQSYELVRGKLSMMHLQEASLKDILLNHSQLIVERSKLALEITQTGQPFCLKPGILRQVVYIFGEALSNVERHAHACKVMVELIWGQQEDLIMILTDDGRGFDPEKAHSSGHFGLKIMQERTATIGGRFDLKSPTCDTKNCGTQLTFWFPNTDLT